ncbi:DUF4174 domain-containing protein [Flagellimonas sp. DF-77]|uniref:DUF4174 domain-containing protein n=1 Tax=Flagellimonas algarum TaxID=3230298 RepID=UPI0033977B72
MASHRWNDRILLIKTTHIESTTFQKQLEVFQNDQSGFEERKLVVYQIVGDRFTVKGNGKSKTSYGGSVSKKVSAFFDEKNPFEVLLIGLDGQIKMRTTEMLTREALFGKIDAMPMRRYELKH